MSIRKINRSISKNPEIIYAAQAIETTLSMPLQTVFPITSRIGKYTFPGLMIGCDDQLYREYGIGEPPPTPDLNFRMLDLDQTDYVIEVALHLRTQRTMRLHLNPVNEYVKYFLQATLKYKVIAFHFYNKNHSILIDSITNMDEEELDWFSRNFALANKLSANPSYDTLSGMIDIMGTAGEKRFAFHDPKTRNVFVENTQQFFRKTDMRHSPKRKKRRKKL